MHIRGVCLGDFGYVFSTFGAGSKKAKLCPRFGRTTILEVVGVSFEYFIVHLCVPFRLCVDSFGSLLWPLGHLLAPFGSNRSGAPPNVALVILTDLGYLDTDVVFSWFSNVV